MYLNLSDYQFKTSRYSYRSTSMNPMVTTNQNHKNEKERNTSIPLKKIIKPQREKQKEKEQKTTKQPGNK